MLRHVSFFNLWNRASYCLNPHSFNISRTIFVVSKEVKYKVYSPVISYITFFIHALSFAWRERKCPQVRVWQTTLLVKQRRCITVWHVYILSTFTEKKYKSPCVHARVCLWLPTPPRKQRSFNAVHNRVHFFAVVNLYLMACVWLPKCTATYSQEICGYIFVMASFVWPFKYLIFLNNLYPRKQKKN